MENIQFQIYDFMEANEEVEDDDSDTVSDIIGKNIIHTF